MYTSAAQYDDPQEYPVNKACNGIDGASEGTDTLGRIFSGIVALRGESSCYDVLMNSSPMKHWTPAGAGRYAITGDMISLGSTIETVK